MSAQTKVMTPRTLARLFVVVFLFPLLPMLISGDWTWWEAWPYALISSMGFVVSRVLAARRHPDILEEHARSMDLQDAKPWDKILAPGVAFGSILILVIAGLDQRFNWTSPFPLTVNIIALIVIFLGFLFGSWALVENRFFSGVVRIQKDRGHHVISSGPYRFIRHPGYAGALWTYVFLPLLLDSAWAVIPAVSLIGVLSVHSMGR